MRFGLARHELAAIRIDRSRPDEIRFELRSSRDEPGVLVASREGVGGPITLTCTIGRFGDTKRERELLSAVGRRLEQLRGVEIAPERD